ncbi:zinc finger protein OZF-like [Culicoides brevitarsis]|uniref:zinc finger protein OZF-like n=1 Tax=Culicoides brevitarsis TaxID=469753 RepID=UPI00307BE531
MEQISQCRCCLAPETALRKHISIFQQDLQQIYNELTQIQLLPDSAFNNICLMCSKLLQSFSEFRLQCLDANNFFAALEKNVTEVIEEEEKIPEIVENDEIETFVIEEDENEPPTPPSPLLPNEIEEIPAPEPEVEERPETPKPPKIVKKRTKFTKIPPSDFYVCEHCPEKVFTNKQYYREHLKIHKEGKLECHFCGLKYRSKYFLLGHIDRNHLEKDYGREGDFACNICPKRYLTETRLKKHMSIHKLTKKPCPHCGELVKNLTSHMAKHYEEKPFRCDKCDKSYKSRQHLQNHVIVHENKSFPCDICGRTFNRPDKVISHKRIHETNRPVFECPECQKQFNYKTALTCHMRIHTGERPYKCTVCGIAFALSGNLSKHMHSHTQTKPYMCKICPFGTKKKTELEFHLRNNHEFLPETAEEQQMQTILVDMSGMVEYLV